MAKRGRPVSYRVVDGVIYKVCSRCRMEKPETEFNKFSPEAAERYRTILTSRCKSCCADTQREIISRRKKKLSEGLCVAPSSKKCLICGESKPIDDFGINRSAPDGHSMYCKPCNREYERTYYKNHPPKKKPPKSRKVRRLKSIDLDEQGNPIGRVCSMCKQYKLAENFTIQKRDTFSSLRNICKMCENEKRRAGTELSDYIVESRVLRKDGLKKCRECGEIKPITEFHSRSGNKVNPACKPCACKKISEFKKEHREQYNEYGRRRNLSKKHVTGSHSITDWRIMRDISDNKCMACGSSDDLTRDHVFPITRHGTDYISNIQVLCVSCNASKGNKTIIDFRWKIYHKLESAFDMSLPQVDCDFSVLISV